MGIGYPVTDEIRGSLNIRQDDTGGSVSSTGNLLAEGTITSNGALTPKAGINVQAGSGTPTTGVLEAAVAGGAAVTAGGSMLSVINAKGLQTIVPGTVPGSLLTALGTALASSTAETEIAAATIPLSDVVAGSTWLLESGGVYSTTSTPTLAYGLRYGGAGGTSIAATAATTTGSGVSALAWSAKCILQFYDTTHATGHLWVDLGTSNSTNATTRLSATSGATSVTVVTSTAKNLSLTATWGTSSSSNTLTPVFAYGIRLA